MTEAPLRVDFHFDPLCPFAYQTSLWIREVRRELGVAVDWRFFSLEEVNRAEGQKHPWERDWSYGWSMMRIGVVLRRRDMDLLDAWYGAVGRALHVEGRKPHRPEVARELLAGLDLDPGVVDEALADPTTHDEVLADHRRVVAAGGFGVPTLFFGDGQCLFGPVVIDPPSGRRPSACGSSSPGCWSSPASTSCSGPRRPRISGPSWPASSPISTVATGSV